MTDMRRESSNALRKFVVEHPADAVVEILRLRIAIADAIELANEGWGYADPYFRVKWEFEDRRDAIVAALMATQ